MHYNDKFRIGNIHISITDLDKSKKEIEKLVLKNIPEHICVSDFRSICYANSNPDYAKIMRTSFMNIPDGMPLIWIARLWGIKSAQRTSGPELFIGMLKNENNNIKHFLIGDTNEVLSRIKEEYPRAFIVGTYSPPFINLNAYDYGSIATIINTSGANIVWISMTAPKQDYFAINIKPLLDNKVIIGVGAAFRFSLGYYTLPNILIQRLGLTGLFIRKKTFWQFKWYFIHSIKLLKYILQIIASRILGKKHFE